MPKRSIKMANIRFLRVHKSRTLAYCHKSGLPQERDSSPLVALDRIDASLQICSPDYTRSIRPIIRMIDTVARARRRSTDAARCRRCFLSLFTLCGNLK
ncbi:unnamed protein product, partial [Nesidiocoris tenuis]